MGYSSFLYEVDLDGLRSALGSKDHKLIERVRKAEAAQLRKDGMLPVEADPSRCPRLRVTRDAELFLNGQPVSWDEFRAEIVRPRWRTTTLYLYVEPGAGKRQEMFQNFGNFVVANNTLLEKAKIRAFTSLDHDPEKLLEGERKFTAIDALADLIDGKVTHPDPENAHQYGYALEKLCSILGKLLIDVCGLDKLELETPLARSRTPVPLPRIIDFPFISFLTADEVDREVRRLGELDLLHSKRGIQQERKSFYQSLKKAARRKKAIVCFYY